MYNRYQGNTGRVIRVDDRQMPEKAGSGGHMPARPQPQQAPPRHQPQRPGPMTARQPGLMEQLGQILPNSLGELETEDIILMLMLYLMYRESGDSELLMIMGGMFLL